MSKRLKLFSVLISVMLISVFSGQTVFAETQIQSVLDLIQQRAQQIKNYTVDYDLQIIKGQEQVNSSGKIVFQEPDKFFMQIEVAELEGLSQVFISDGQTMWQYLPSLNMSTKMDIKEAKKETAEEYLDNKADLRSPFANLKKDSLKIIEEKGTNGESIYVLEGIAVQEIKDQSIADVYKSNIWISPSIGIPSKVVWYDENGNVVISQEFKNIEINQQIDESIFVFSPPEGVEVIDVTDQISPEIQE